MADPSPADRARVLFVAGVEIAVSDTYRALLDNGGLAPDVADTVLVLSQHHDEHATALAALGLTPRADVSRNTTLYAELNQTVLGPDPLPAILAAEQALVATHLVSLGTLSTTDTAAAVAAIMPIEADHAVVIGVAGGIALASPQLLPALDAVDAAYDESRYPAP
jgi:hypothetical protein